MLAITQKEIRAFFASSVGVLILSLFLILCGLFLWVFNGPFNIFNYGFADLSKFFLLAPWVFLFLVPALTMKSFAEERKLGTLELLQITPLPKQKIVWGKFFGIFILACLAILPTIIYVYTLGKLGTFIDNYDHGIVIASYLGMLLLVAAFTGIGLFASSLTDNQVVAFLVGLILCFTMFYGFESISTLFSEGSLALFIKNLGMKAHFESMGRGVIDSRDVIYFLSILAFSIFLCTQRLKRKA